MIRLPLLSIDFWPLDVLCFCLLLWLGLYLLKRNLADRRVCLSGFSLLFAACAEGCFVLHTVARPLRFQLFEVAQWLLLTSVLLWLATLALGLIWYPWPAHKTRFALISLMILLLFVLHFTWLPYTAARVLICAMLFFLGLTMASLDAREQGEALLPDLLRSFDYAFLTALLFGGQVVLLLLFALGVTFPSLLLLLTTLASAIIVQVFSSPFVKLLDRIAFATFPQLMQARAELHIAADVLPLRQPEVDLEGMDEVEFARLTRRALSHLGNLSQLASNPLTRMPIIESNLRARGVKDENVLEGAAELKKLLTDSICRLKPRGKGDFGTSDEWRYYNALYFPYVLGLKPYSRRSHYPLPDPIASKAMDWFLTQIPERTLHNWQNAAAKLVAQDIRVYCKAKVAS